jgi:uncharacterized protein (DUF1330 family)
MNATIRFLVRFFSVMISLLALTLAGTSVVNAQTKQVVYLIADVSVNDAAIYQKYLDANTPIVTKFGGRFLTRGEDVEKLDGAKSDRFAIIEFDSREKLMAFRNSKEYKDILPLRDRGSTFRSFMVTTAVSATVGK